MRRPLLLLPILLLAACTQTASATRTLKLTITDPDTSHRSELIAASSRVIDRRLQAVGDRLVSHSEKDNGSGGVLMTVGSETGAALSAVVEDLQKPFSLEMMLQVPDSKGADIVTQEQGAFKKTGFNQDDIAWTSVEDQKDGKSQINLIFTPAGLKKMQTLYANNAGKVIGMFVRGQLVSMLKVDSGALKERIVIGGVPNHELASTFSDDVNVGRYVTFTPVNGQQ